MLFFTFILLFCFVLSVIFFFGWIPLYKTENPTKRRQTVRRVWLQLALIGLGFAIVFGGFEFLIALIIFPGFLLTTIDFISSYKVFLEPVIIKSIGVGVAILMLTLLFDKTKRWSLLIVAFALFGSCFVFAELRSKSLMCERTTALGVTEINRNSIKWSIANAPKDFQSGLHAELIQKGKRFYWSYRRLDWIELKPTISAQAYGNTITC